VPKPEWVAKSFQGEPGAWDNTIRSLPNPHLLQSAEWGQIKSQFGWKPLQYIWQNPSGETAAAALLLVREIYLNIIAARLKVIYIPKGPLLDWNDAPLRRKVLEDLGDLARQQQAILLKIDPDIRLGEGIPGQVSSDADPLGLSVIDDLKGLGWCLSEEQIQFRNTVLVNLIPNQDVLLARMKQKTRYNIRLAQRKDIRIRVGDCSELGMLFRMYAETANRDKFVIRDEAYYLALWGLFLQAGMAESLIAEASGEPAAALMVFRFGKRAWYLYGMSRPIYREWMPNYLLQWEAMLRAKAAGCETYDLWGAPDVFNEDDPLWGVYRFKEGFGGEIVRTIGAWDLPIRPVLYRFYMRVLPRILDFLRWRGVARTRQMVE
jgi:lipid II:glycine glycyltransferase (peptidoglycan interpeptide bridge formation enzyme)